MSSSTDHRTAVREPPSAWAAGVAVFVGWLMSVWSMVPIALDVAVMWAVAVHDPRRH